MPCQIRYRETAKTMSKSNLFDFKCSSWRQVDEDSLMQWCAHAACVSTMWITMRCDGSEQAISILFSIIPRFSRQKWKSNGLRQKRKAENQNAFNFYGLWLDGIIVIVVVFTLLLTAVTMVIVVLVCWCFACNWLNCVPTYKTCCHFRQQQCNYQLSYVVDTKSGNETHIERDWVSWTGKTKTDRWYI